jgi:WhiB family redox-sensing transcriptional regulator
VPDVLVPIPLSDLLDRARPAWHRDAACVGTDPEVFFAEGHNRTLYDEARTICAACPVLDDCRLDADRYETASRTFGFVAGETPAERGRRRRASGTTPVRNRRRTPNIW